MYHLIGHTWRAGSRFAWLTALLLIVSMIGCGAAESGSSKNNARPTTVALPQSTQSTQSTQTQSESRQSPGSSTSHQRKIVYNSSVEVTVETFDGVETKVAEMIRSHDGFVASANLSRLQGSSRLGIWGLRVPVDNYAKLMDAASDLGVLASRVEKADDVTAEYYDLEARLKNKKQLESRIISLLASSTDTLKQIIEVEQELARVREEIEKLQGQLRYLSDVSQLATITLTVREVNQPVVSQQSPFTERLGNAWNAAYGQLISTLTESTLFLVRNLFRMLGFLAAAFFVIFLFRKQPMRRVGIRERA